MVMNPALDTLQFDFTISWGLGTSMDRMDHLFVVLAQEFPKVSRLVARIVFPLTPLDRWTEEERLGYWQFMLMDDR